MEYTFCGIRVISEFELPFLSNHNLTTDSTPIEVRLGAVPNNLTNEAAEQKPFSKFNENELLLKIPEVANFYVKDGDSIVIDCSDVSDKKMLYYVYSKCLPIALAQRGLYLFHFSGVKLHDGSVALISSEKREGKSTAAAKLSESGLPLFCDEMVLIEYIDDTFFATPATPVVNLKSDLYPYFPRLKYQENHPLDVFPNYSKTAYAIENYEEVKKPIAKIFFLQEGHEEAFEKLTVFNTFEKLQLSVYNRELLLENDVPFFLSLAGKVPAYSITKPEKQYDLLVFSAFLLPYFRKK